MKLNDISRKLKKSTKNFGRALNRRSPEILIGCGLVGFVTTCVLVAKAAPVARDRLDDLHKELGEKDEEISKAKVIFEEAKTVLPVYAPAIVSGTMSCACILCSYRISSKRTAALALSYELAQSNLIDYQNKVREKLGENKEREIQHEINEEKIKSEPVPEEYRNELAYTDGMTVFKDRYGRFFRSNMEIVRKAEKKISDRLTTEMYISLNEFYYELGIGSTDAGDDLYFTVEKGIDVVTDPIKNTDGNTITYLTWLNPPEEIFSQGSTSVYKY